MAKMPLVMMMSSRRAPVTEEEAARFLEDPTRVAEEEWWRILARRKGPALSEDQILRAVAAGDSPVGGSSIFPTARVAGAGAIPPLPLEYVRPYTRWLQGRDRGEICSLPITIRVLRLSVWLATGVVMLLGMYRK
jgi:hypothetical protein